MNRSPRQKWSPAKTFAPQTAAAVIERIQVQDLTERELQRLPFGAIQLDTIGSSALQRV